MYSIEKVGNNYVINTVKDDTSGCLLVGTKKGKNSVLYSKAAYAEVFNLINTLLKSGELEITIKNIEVKPETPASIAIKPTEEIITEQPIINQIIPIDDKATILSIILNFLKKWKSYFPNL